jgi:hypothetical protein
VGADADAVDYFAGGRIVMVQREGYEEPVHIPACPPAAVEAAIAEAVRQGSLWLVNGPASFQGEPVSAGVLTAGAQLRAPMLPIPVDRLSQNALSNAWKDGQTTPLAMSVALAAQNENRPVPWSIMQQAIDAAIASRWLELAPGSIAWPCDMAGASAVTLKQPASGGGAAESQPGGGVYVSRPPGIYHAMATLEPSAFQDLVEVLPDLIKIAAGVSLKFSLSVTLGDGQEIAAATLEKVKELLEHVSAELRFTQ